MTPTEILELSINDLESLDTKTLEQYHKILEDESSISDVNQLSLKILINSLYGALANQYFLLANPDLAAAITASGRFFIRLLAINIETRLQELLKSNKPYVISGDTDSVVYDSELILEDRKITIGELFDKTKSNVEVTENGSEIKKIQGLKSLTYSQDKGAHFSNIAYIMRHKVKKKMYKINSEGESVIVTEDHSIKVIRDGKLIDVKPNLITKGDKIILTKEVPNVQY